MQQKIGVRVVSMQDCWAVQPCGQLLQASLACFQIRRCRQQDS